jgi:hypothetical protein
MDSAFHSALTEFERVYADNTPTIPDFCAPSRFTRDEPGVLIPLDDTHGLAQYSRALKTLSIESTVSLLPPWWQLDALACVSHEQNHIPHATAHPENVSVAVELIRQLTPQLLLTDIDTGYAIAQALHEKHIALPLYWYIIESYQTHRTYTLPGTTIVHEWHLTLGVPILCQCPDDTSHIHVGKNVVCEAEHLHVHHARGTLDIPLISLPYPVKDEPCNSRV